MIQQYRFEELFHTEFKLLMKREIKQYLQVAIEAYNHRDRRYGLVKEE